MHLFLLVRRSVRDDAESDDILFTADGDLVLSKLRLGSSHSREFCLADSLEGDITDLYGNDKNTDYLAVLSSDPCKYKV